jgi:ubiquinone biosynthesis protein Coq4
MNVISGWNLKLKMLVQAIKIIRNPYELENIKSLSGELENSGDIQKIVNFYKRNPVTAEAFVKKPRLGAVSLAALGELPAGTLGREYFEYLTKRKLDPNDLLMPEGESEVSYFMNHMYEAHDLWHVVTGFETDVAGELGLQAFYAAQNPGALAIALIALGLLNGILYEREDIPNRLDAITKGWQMGKEAGHLFGVDWKARWNEPVGDIRRHLLIHQAKAA